MSIWLKIPGIRTLVRHRKLMQFHKAWRKNNAHNDLTVGNRIFPIAVVEGGKGSYGALNVQSLFEQDFPEKLFHENNSLLCWPLSLKKCLLSQIPQTKTRQRNELSVVFG